MRFVLDETATHPLDRWDWRGTLTAQQVMDRTGSAFQGGFVEVVTLEQVLTS